MTRRALSWVGEVSHINCVDRRITPTGVSGEYQQLESIGLPRLVQLCALFDAKPVKAMARCAPVTEVFLELSNNVQVHYTGVLGATHEECSLWIEGNKGSLKASGSWLLWRKRGWPKFVPVGLNFLKSESAESTFSQKLLVALKKSVQEKKVVTLDS
jgi:hypothetical protein